MDTESHMHSTNWLEKYLVSQFEHFSFIRSTTIYFFGTVENFAASAPYFLFLFSIGVAILCEKIVDTQIFQNYSKGRRNHPFCVALSPTGLPVFIKDQVRHQTVASLTSALYLTREDMISNVFRKTSCSHPWG